mmetsp:Transcript_11867/g.22827  ORF Transcript_11867/g.22827 Transcript_11867/m.22827 type:complete len:679 (-) Transcript_11867:416-2452(-)
MPRGSPTTSSARRRAASLPHLVSSPRTMLGCVLLFFVMSHTIMMQRTLDRHYDDDVFIEQRQQQRQGQGRQSGTAWHQDWKLRRTQSVDGRKPGILPQKAMQDAFLREKVATTDNNNNNNNNVMIRSWGANLTTTPLIYVHIGKAGGGTIRARFSSARPTFIHKDWRKPDMDATYQVANPDGTTTTSPAYFCNSGHATFRSTPRVLYEMAFVCHATTPLGAMIACPEHFFPINEQCPVGCSLHDETCHQVYMGHNIPGAEFHWLPYKVLQKWWRETFRPPLVSNQMYETFAQYLETLSPDNPDWCPYEGEGLARPHNGRQYKNRLLTCQVPLSHAVDHYAHRLLDELQQASARGLPQHPHHHKPSNHLDFTLPAGTGEDWSFVYASLPVLRTTIIREPWSWLVSKFFWMGNWHLHDLECDSIVQAVSLDGQSRSKRRRRRLLEEHADDYAEEEEKEEDGWLPFGDKYNGDGGEEEEDEQSGNRQDQDADHSQNEQPRKKHVMPLHHPDSTIVTDTDGYGWASRYAMLYILYLCGEDCAARWEMSSAGYNDEILLAELEQQAANNLRQSFAVVGLLQETDTFFDMVTARVQYIDMSIHADVEGELHDTGTNGYIAKCKETFKNPGFRQKLREACPPMAALERLYDVAVEVNRFQVRELAASPHVDPAVRERLQKVADQF